MENRFGRSLTQSAFLRIVFRFYRYLLSPFLRAISGGGFGCRYEPSCSHYSQECFEKFHVFKAVYLTIRRILRCNPWIDADVYDPVPKTRSVVFCNSSRKVSN